MANTTKFIEALMEEARLGHLPPPFVRALKKAEGAGKKATVKAGRRPKTTKL